MNLSPIRLRLLAGSTALLAAAAAMISPASADPKVTLGTLTCHGHGGVGLIFGSKENMNCEFTTAVAGRVYPYHATITQVGLDIGFTGASTLVWTVLGSTNTLPADALEGTYGGVTAGVAVGIGAAANALIGGSNQSIVLQPVSVEGQTGINLSAGVAGLSLRRT